MHEPGAPCECAGIQHIDPGDAVRLDGRVFRQFDRLRGVEMVKELHKRLGLLQHTRILFESLVIIRCMLKSRHLIFTLYAPFLSLSFSRFPWILKSVGN
jgi:hypothetical protein